MLQRFIETGVLQQDKRECVYIYRLNWRNVDQTGFMLLSSVDDYFRGNIKRHEFTRPDKEADRTRLTDVLNAQTGPVFLFYHRQDELNRTLEEETHNSPVYDFTVAEVRHRLWVVDDPVRIQKVVDGFAQLEATYIADGHHRCAAAANVCKLRRQQQPRPTGEESFNYFLSVIFPEEQLHILPYNRVVKDLNGLEADTFFTRVRERFEVQELPPAETVEPERDNTLGMYYERRWYRLLPRPNSFNRFDPIESLEVSILQRNLLQPILGIEKPRTDKRIDFVGGIRGTQELVRLVDSGGFRVAFVVPPVTIEALRKVADSGGVMPPKSTWFEPKLRSGLVTHIL